MWQIVLFVVGASGFNKTRKRLERENKRLVVCLNCETEMQVGARCCRSCGSSELMKKVEFLKHKEEAKVIRQRYQTLQREQRSRYYEAKKAYEAARISRRCPSCGRVYDSKHAYCTVCEGMKTVRLPESEAKGIIYAKYPDIVQSDGDLEQLEAFGEIRRDESMANPAVDFTKKAIKGTIRLGWRGTKSVLREFLK